MKRTYFVRIRHVWDCGSTIKKITDEGDPNVVLYENVAPSSLKNDTSKGTLSREILNRMFDRGVATVMRWRHRRKHQ